jgi:flavorubredoxin
MTMNQHAPPGVQGILDEATCIRKVDKDVVVFRVLHGYNQVVRTFKRKVRANGHEVRNAKLSSEVDGLGGGETAR